MVTLTVSAVAVTELAEAGGERLREVMLRSALVEDLPLALRSGAASTGRPVWSERSATRRWEGRRGAGAAREPRPAAEGRPGAGPERRAGETGAPARAGEAGTGGRRRGAPPRTPRGSLGTATRPPRPRGQPPEAARTRAGGEGGGGEALLSDAARQAALTTLR